MEDRKCAQQFLNGVASQVTQAKLQHRVYQNGAELRVRMKREKENKKSGGDETDRKVRREGSRQSIF